MRKTKIALFCVFCALALVIACAGVVLAMANREAAPVLVNEDPQARQTAQALLEAVSRGDYEQASRQMLGKPDMGIDREAEDPVGMLIWQAYREKLTFTPVGDGYASASGVTYDYEIRHLDMGRLADELHWRSQELLLERVEQAEDVSEVYDENNEYREDFVLKVLQDAAEQMLMDDGIYKTETISVYLVWRQERWWVVPDAELIQVITGVSVDL